MPMLKRGDRVRVMGTVDYDQQADSDRVSVRLDTALDGLRLDATAVEFLHHEIKPGQWVDNGEHEPAKVLAVAHGYAMVRCDEHNVEAWSLEGLTPYATLDDARASAEAPEAQPRLVPDRAPQHAAE